MVFPESIFSIVTSQLPVLTIGCQNRFANILFRSLMAPTQRVECSEKRYLSTMTSGYCDEIEITGTKTSLYYDLSGTYKKLEEAAVIVSSKQKCQAFSKHPQIYNDAPVWAKKLNDLITIFMYLYEDNYWAGEWPRSFSASKKNTLCKGDFCLILTQN